MNVTLTIGIGGIIGLVAAANMLNLLADIQVALNTVFCI